MLEGRTQTAVRLIVEHSHTGPLPLTAHNIALLKEKHPSHHLPSRTFTNIHDPLPELPTLLITNTHVHEVARQIQGGSGPGGTDSIHWRDALTIFGASSESLRKSVAQLSNSLANELVPWDRIQALLSNRLIALDKSPGIRPIAIGETLRRLIAKIVLLTTKHQVTEACGVYQTCAGLSGGIEGSFHAMRQLFEDNKTEGWGVLLIDAKNAFNSCNRITILVNALRYWPKAGRFVFNCYKGPQPLILSNSLTLYSQEWVAQGDPLSMFLYALGTLSLISITTHPHTRSTWYADDASACVGHVWGT
eukprot:GHVR01101381.1.p1 GENE.GHVR01101381.1~~GHVR01101381.1.p1  ORF type:complete len:305 (+),score=17.62 GHVR01101381.1:158-1072(+)